MDQLKALDMDEEQRNREKAFLEFEINEIEEAALIPGEDETLEGTLPEAEQCQKDHGNSTNGSWDDRI